VTTPAAVLPEFVHLLNKDMALISFLEKNQIVKIISAKGLFSHINRFNNTLAVLPE